MAIKDIIATGIGFSPGNVKFIVTRGFLPSTVVTVAPAFAPTAFDLSLAEAADKFLANAFFAEAVTYKPSGGSSRAITVIVDREIDQSLPAFAQAAAPLLRVTARNSATEAITPDELNTGLDEINLPRRIGETARDFTIASLVSQDYGMIKMECR